MKVAGMKKRRSSIIQSTVCGRCMEQHSGLAASFGLLVLSTAEAHQQKNAVTRILFNENTGNIEVMHRFFIHDAEHAAGLIFGERQMLAESRESRELFSSYVINRFSIEASFREGNPEVLSLSYVGEEVDGQFLWVYQEIPAQEGITAFTIENLALEGLVGSVKSGQYRERRENIQPDIRRFGRSTYRGVGSLIRVLYAIGVGFIYTDHSEKICSTLAGATVIVFRYLSRQILQIAAVVTLSCSSWC